MGGGVAVAIDPSIEEIDDLKLAVRAALAEVKASSDAAVDLRVGGKTPPPSAVATALSRMAAAVPPLNAAVAALSAAGVPTSLQDPQLVALNTAIATSLTLWQTTLKQLRQAGVSGI